MSCCCRIVCSHGTVFSHKTSGLPFVKFTLPTKKNTLLESVCSFDAIHRFITFMFSTLIGSTLLAGLIVTPALIVHFFWYKPHPTSHRRYVMDNLEAWLFWIASNLLISWYLALIVDLAPIFARVVIAVFWGHVSESVKNKIEMYNIVKNAFKPLLYAISIWVSWIILFENIYHLYDSNNTANSVASYTPRVSYIYPESAPS